MGRCDLDPYTAAGCIVRSVAECAKQGCDDKSVELHLLRRRVLDEQTGDLQDSWGAVCAWWRGRRRDVRGLIPLAKTTPTTWTRLTQPPAASKATKW